MTAELSTSTMDAAEARACVAAINHHLNGARRLLLELYEREGWRTLGYASWRDCVVSEFRHERYAYYLLDAARTERELRTIVQPAELPSLREFHLRQIAQLPAPERREVALELARKELNSEQHRRLIAERTRAARANRVLAAPVPGPLPRSVDVRVADAAALPWPDGSVDLIVTSPPYSLAKVYDGGVDDDLPYPDYLERARAWAAEMYRVAGSQGRVCLNVAIDSTRGGPRPLYADWLGILMDAGWSYRTTIVWADNDVGRHTARGSNSPSAVHVMTPVEVIGVLHKGSWNLGRHEPHDLAHDEWLTWTHGLWTFPNNHSGRWDHPCPFPIELARRCIKLFSFPSARIGDPFVGTGTTMVAALRTGRWSCGTDLSERYVAMARARVAAELKA